MKAFLDHIYAIQIGFEQLFKGKFWLYILPSVIVSLIFYGVYSFINGFYTVAHTVEEVPLVGEYIGSGIQATIGFFGFIALEFYKFFILTCLSPVNSMLSQKVDNELTGASFSGGIERMLIDFGRAILLFIITLLLNICLIALWWGLAAVTGFHLLDGFIYFAISSFFIGFSFYDYSLERYKIGVMGGLGFGFEKIGYLFFTGSLFTLIYMLPTFIGVILAPFLVTIISTIVYLKMNNKIPVNGEKTNES